MRRDALPRTSWIASAIAVSCVSCAALLGVEDVGYDRVSDGGGDADDSEAPGPDDAPDVDGARDDGSDGSDTVDVGTVGSDAADTGIVCATPVEWTDAQATLTLDTCEAGAKMTGGCDADVVPGVLVTITGRRFKVDAYGGDLHFVEEVSETCKPVNGGVCGTNTIGQLISIGDQAFVGFVDGRCGPITFSVTPN